MSTSVIYYAPNVMNYFRVFFVILSIYYIRKKPFHSFAFTLLSGLIDTFDGDVARYTNRRSKLGGVMDYGLDKLSSIFKK